MIKFKDIDLPLITPIPFHAIALRSFIKKDTQGGLGFRAKRDKEIYYVDLSTNVAWEIRDPNRTVPNNLIISPMNVRMNASMSMRMQMPSGGFDPKVSVFATKLEPGQTYFSISNNSFHLILQADLMLNICNGEITSRYHDDA